MPLIQTVRQWLAHEPKICKECGGEDEAHWPACKIGIEQSARDSLRAEPLIQQYVKPKGILSVRLHELAKEHEAAGFLAWSKHWHEVAFALEKVRHESQETDG